MLMKSILFILVVTALLFQSCNFQNTSSNDKNANTCFSDTNVISLFEYEEAENIESPEKNEEQVICECFLLDSGRVAVYDTICGEVIDSIQNDYQMESFYTVKVFSQKNDWFRVRAEAIEKGSKGWILNKSLLATYSRNYTDTLFVYSKPDTTSNTECIFPNYFTTAMKVQKCENAWIKVEVENNGKKCTGWVLKSMTCPSPYTTCN
jgi:hypothetical protein